MSANLNQLTLSHIDQEIEMHSAWLGDIQGLKAEKMLRGKKPYVYVLRAGEYSESSNVTNYYVSFVLADGSIRHQPFVITLVPQGWCYENVNPGGPYTNEVSINDVIYLMMHCEKGQNTPLVNFGK